MLMKRLIRSVCPLCTCSRSSDYMTVRQRDEDWHLVACDLCGFLYVQDCWTDTTIDTVMIGIRPPQSRHRQIAQVIRQRVPKGGCVVEVGCGAGQVGFLIKGEYKYRGFDPSRTLAAPSIAAGLDITIGYFRPDGSKADAIVLDNVIEHVLDPMALATDCRRSLKIGGIIILLVPNRYDARRLIPRWSERYHWRPPEHVNYFRRADLRRLFHGMDIQSFGLRALRWPEDRKFFPREALEAIGLHPFGHNVVLS